MNARGYNGYEATIVQDLTQHGPGPAKRGASNSLWITIQWDHTYVCVPHLKASHYHAKSIASTVYKNDAH